MRDLFATSLTSGINRVLGPMNYVSYNVKIRSIEIPKLFILKLIEKFTGEFFEKLSI